MDLNNFTSRLSEKFGALPIIAETAERLGVHVWLVGGIVRDLLLGRPTLDADLAVLGDAGALGRAFAEKTGGTPVFLHDDPETVRVVTGGVEYDFAALRAETIEADLLARDLSINSLAAPLSVNGIGGILDPTGGTADLKYGLLRTVSKKNFLDDPLRALRLYRFRAELDFSCDPQTRKWAAEAAAELDRVTGERILLEMTHLFSTPRAADALSDCAADGVLKNLLPHLFEESTDSGRRASVTAVDPIGIVRVLDDGARSFPAFDERIPGDPVCADPVAMKLAALFHDCGVGMRERKDTALQTVCDRWKASNRLRARAFGILEARFSYFAALRGISTGRERLRVFADYTLAAGEYRLAAPVLVYATLAASNVGSDLLASHAAIIEDLARTDAEIIRPIDEGAPLLSGEDLMAAFRLPPGPQIGRMIGRLREERIAGTVTDRATALEFCRTLLKETEGA